jgi:hypothetical protein
VEAICHDGSLHFIEESTDAAVGFSFFSARQQLSSSRLSPQQIGTLFETGGVRQQHPIKVAAASMSV